MSKMKPRSGLVTDGLERAPARGMLRAVGMGDEDWVKPQIGIASSWNEITPCNSELSRSPMVFLWDTRECTSRLYHVK